MASTAQIASMKRKEAMELKFGKGTIESYTYLSYGKKSYHSGESDFSYSKTAHELWSLCKSVIEDNVTISSVADKAEELANKLYNTKESWIAAMLFEAVGNFNNEQTKGGTNGK